jgi:hypothetical protein
MIESAQRAPNWSLIRAPSPNTTMTILSYPLKHRDTAESSSPGESKLIERVRVVHAQVNGRARLQIDGLYHCEPVCHRVESALAREAGIRQVSANVLTGRVLVLYDPARTVDEIKGRIGKSVTSAFRAASALESLSPAACAADGLYGWQRRFSARTGPMAHVIPHCGAEGAGNDEGRRTQPSLRREETSAFWPK